MRTITVTEKHKAVNEGRMSKSEFVRQMRQSYPMYISPQNGYDATVQILKNKQMLFEEKEYEVDDTFKYSDDSLRRAIDIELEAMGLMSHGTISMEDQDKAKKKAISNLKKDPLHYYHLISGDSSKVNKHDKPVEVKKGNEVDTFNGMKKAELKEDVEKELGASNGEISDLVKNEKHIKDKLDKAGKKYSKSYDKDKHGQKIVVFKLKENLNEGTRALVGYLAGNRLTTAYNHYDGYPSGLGKGLMTHYNNDDLAKDIAMRGYITSMDPDSGEISQTHQDPPKKITLPEDSEEMAREVAEEIDGMGADYGYIWHDEMNQWHTIKNTGIRSMIDQITDKMGSVAEVEINEEEEENWREEYPEAKNSWEYDDQGYGALEAFFDDVIHQFGPEISLEDAKELLDKRGEGGDDTKAFNQAVITQMQSTDDDDMDRKSTQNMIQAYEEKYNEPFSTNLIKHLDTLVYEAKPTLKETLGGIVAFLKSKGAKNDSIKDFIKTHKDDIEGMSMDDVEDEYNNFLSVNTDYVDEKKGKDHDGDGDIDSDDYLAAKDKAIKKAMGKEVNEDVVKKNIKSIITKILEEEVINEAATNDLAKIADEYDDFGGLKPAVISLQNIVTEIESFYDKTREKIQKVYDSLGNVTNDEGLKVAAFITPAIENAFKRDLKHIIKNQFTGGLSMPQVRRISQDDINRGTVQQEAPKDTVFSPVNEKKNKNEK